MSQFEIVKLLVDVGLGISLLYLAIRFLRGGISDNQARQLASLDASLKSLIREAEISGNNLNDQLLRRQQAIETTLRDLESSETRLQRCLSGGKDLSQTLDDQIKKVREDLLEVERRKVRLETYADEQQPKLDKPVVSSPIQKRRIKPEEVQHAEVYLEEQEFIENVPESATNTNFSRVNIYGEPIEDPTPEQIAAGQSLTRSSLQQAVEKIVETKRSSNSLSKPALDAVHAAAEEMLRTGRNLEAVASRTRLSLDEVRGISQKIIKESILQEPTAASIRTKDERLGVLAGARRQDQMA